LWARLKRDKGESSKAQGESDELPNRRGFPKQAHVCSSFPVSAHPEEKTQPKPAERRGMSQVAARNVPHRRADGPTVN
jgi:hypothetical protein